MKFLKNLPVISFFFNILASHFVINNTDKQICDSLSNGRNFCIPDIKRIRKLRFYCKSMLTQLQPISNKMFEIYKKKHSQILFFKLRASRFHFFGKFLQETNTNFHLFE